MTVTSSTSAGSLVNFFSVSTISDGTYLYVANGKYNNAALNSYDVSDETSISLADSIQSNSIFNGLTHISADWDNDFLFASTANNYDLHVYDISDPTDMVKVDTYTNSTNAPYPSGTVVDSANLNVYLLNFSRGKLASFSYNASSGALTHLSTLSNASLDGLYPAIDLDNEVVYVMDILQKRLTSVDISNPSSMSVLDYISIPGSGYYTALDVGRQLAFVGRDEINCIDISDSSNLTLLSTISITDNTAIDFVTEMKCDTDREYLFAACRDTNKIVVIDYSDTSSLSVASTTDTSTIVSHRTLSLIR
jgi:6-phosphogluconolactonase (cycloisomerase 2 family)